MGIEGKRGLSSLMLFFFVLIVFFMILFFGIMLFGSNLVNSAFASIDFSVGNVSFNQTYNETIAPALNTFPEIADNFGVGILFGMIIIMIIVGFSMRQSRLWIVLDLFVIIIAFVLAVILSRAFETFINLNNDFLDIYSITLEKSSTFILNLPIMVTIAGALIMLMTYAITRKPAPQEPTVFEAT